MNTISKLQQNYYGDIASGRKLETASDGAAQMTIVQEEKGQIAGYETGAGNGADGKSVLNVADGGLEGITDSLQRMRELALKASNSALMSGDEKEGIQKEINQLKENIEHIGENTQYNTKKLLDGSQTGMHIATEADGSGMDLVIESTTLDALGLRDFDVRGDFSIEDIDNALKKVSTNRSNVGAQSNSLDYAIGYNTQTSYNLTAATSRMEDTDVEKAVTEKNKQQALQNYRYMIQNKQMEAQKNTIKNFFE